MQQPQVVYSQHPGVVDEKKDNTNYRLVAALIAALLAGGGGGTYGVLTARDAKRVTEGHATLYTEEIARLTARDEEKTKAIARLEGIADRLEQVVNRLEAEKKAEEKVEAKGKKRRW